MPEPITETAIPSAFVGIDVSKEKLDVCVMPDGELHAFDNDTAAPCQVGCLGEIA